MLGVHREEEEEEEGLLGGVRGGYGGGGVGTKIMGLQMCMQGFVIFFFLSFLPDEG